MLRSLFAGISGLRVNQTMLDVTGNNIANANTIGFKSSNTVFQDTLS
jgi:flagellar hook protein FlgE